MVDECKCIDNLEMITEDRLYPYGDVESIALYRCKKCGRIYTEFEDGLLEIISEE